MFRAEKKKIEIRKLPYFGRNTEIPNACAAQVDRLRASNYGYDDGYDKEQRLQREDRFSQKRGQ